MIFSIFCIDFPNLNNYQNLAKFWPFNFPDFLASSSLPLPTSNQTTLLLLFFISDLDTSGDPVVFSIEVSRATILLKP